MYPPEKTTRAKPLLVRDHLIVAPCGENIDPLPLSPQKEAWFPPVSTFDQTSHPYQSIFCENDGVVTALLFPFALVRRQGTEERSIH